MANTAKMGKTEFENKTVIQANKLAEIVNRLGKPQLLKNQPVTASETKFVVECAKKQYKRLGTALIEVESPVNICGDTHGQYRDVMRLFHMNGWPHEGTKYLFLGDYVDRGSRSVELMVFLFAMRLMTPKTIDLLRGNHEAEEINGYYGFKDECIRRFGDEPGLQLWKDFNETFWSMPLAALVKVEQGGRMFCMHGGIPMKPMEPDFDELRQLKLPIKSPREHEIVSELLWSDPNEAVDEFVKNPRGLGRQFGPSQVVEFCARHDIDLIVRAHQVFKEGYKYMGSNCITIFSAPNYGGAFDNNAVCLRVGKKKSDIHINVVAPMHKKGE